MGCLFSRGRSSNEYVAENRIKDKESNASISLKQLSTSSRCEKVAIEADGIINDATARMISNPSQNGTSGSTPISWDEGEMNEEITVKMQIQMSSEGTGIVEQVLPRVSRIVSISRGKEEHKFLLAGRLGLLLLQEKPLVVGYLAEPNHLRSLRRLAMEHTAVFIECAIVKQIKLLH